MPIAWVDESKEIAEFMLSESLFYHMRRNNIIKDYLGRLCHNNKTRITDFFSNPGSSLRFLPSTLIAELKKVLEVQKAMITFSEQMPLSEIASLRVLQCEAAEAKPSKELPYQSAVEAISFKLGHFLIADDTQGVSIINL